jgi:Na+/melibiose symporter-like transporter
MPETLNRSVAPLQRGVLLAYAAPAFSQALIHGPTGAVLQGIYAKQFGLTLQSIALVLLLAGIADAVSNPLIGFASDRYRARFGSRKPWLIGGSLLAAVACWYLYAPTPPVTTIYFGVWLMVAYLAWATSEIPYGAWIAEITLDYNERTRLAAWKASFTYLGAMTFFAIPFLPVFDSTEFTAETLRWTAWVAAVALPAMVALAVVLVPDGATTVSAPQDRESVRLALRSIARNPPLLLFLAVFTLVALGSGIMNGVLFFYFDSYLHQGHALAGLFAMALPVGAVAVPVWGWSCRRFGKTRAWAMGSAAGTVGILAYGFIPPGPSGTLALGAVMILVVASFTVTAVAAPAVLADVIDYGRLRFGVDHGGTYFSLYVLLNRALTGLSAAIGLTIAAAFGFDPGLTVQTATGHFGLSLAFYLLPAALMAVTIPLLWRFPIDAKRQQTIARYLQRRNTAKMSKEN